MICILWWQSYAWHFVFFSYFGLNIRIFKPLHPLMIPWYRKYMQYFKKVTDCSQLILISISSYENYYALHTWMCQTFYAELPLRSFWILMVLIAFRELYSTNMKLEDNYTYISTSLNSIWYVALDFETKGVNISIILLTESIHQFQYRNSEFWFIKFAVSFNLVKERTLLHKIHYVPEWKFWLGFC